MASNSASKTVLYTAIAGNLLVAATKFGAAIFTGSAAMLSEGVHSVVDSGNEVLLLYGLRRSTLPPDTEHPLGYGREIYFWSFVVALLIFALGAGVSILEGILRILEPEPIESPMVSYVVLALSAVFEGASWLVVMRRFESERREQGLIEAVRESKDPPSFTVLFEDSAALIGIAIAAAGTFLATQANLPVFDGIASVLIGLVLAATASFLARESKGLLIGERADKAIVDSITQLARDKEGVCHANDVLTVHLAPRQIVVALNLEFADEMNTPQIEAAVLELERSVRQQHPEVTAVFVKPQSARTFAKASAA